MNRAFPIDPLRRGSPGPIGEAAPVAAETEALRIGHQRIVPLSGRDQPLDGLVEKLLLADQCGPTFRWEVSDEVVEQGP